MSVHYYCARISVIQVRAIHFIDCAVIYMLISNNMFYDEKGLQQFIYKFIFVIACPSLSISFSSIND